MNKLPKISIVTPSYNQGQFIEDTILSVLGQNYPNLEYIIIDGNSTDNTVEIIKKYSERLTYWVSEPDSGQAEAINRGFEKSTGDILLWLNSDDMFMPNVLQFIADCVLQNGDGIYFGNTIHFREEKALTCNGSDVVGDYRNYGIEEIDFIEQPSSFWTKDVWKEVGKLKEDIHFVFDWEWFVRAKRANIRFFPLGKTLSLYRIHNTHKTGVGGEKRQKEILAMYKQYNPPFASLYELLVCEGNLKSSIGFRFLLAFHIIYCKIKNTSVSHGSKLKFLKPKKYKDYTIQDIDVVCQVF